MAVALLSIIKPVITLMLYINQKRFWFMKDNELFYTRHCNGSQKLVLVSRRFVVGKIIVKDLFRLRKTKGVDRPNVTPVVLCLLL